jgi:hypothetical protein
VRTIRSHWQCLIDVRNLEHVPGRIAETCRDSRWETDAARRSQQLLELPPRSPSRGIVMGVVHSTLNELIFPPAPLFTEDSVPDLSGKVALVTGANAGIGKETARVSYEDSSACVPPVLTLRLGVACEKRKSLDRMSRRVQGRGGSEGIEGAHRARCTPAQA